MATSCTRRAAARSCQVQGCFGLPCLYSGFGRSLLVVPQNCLLPLLVLHQRATAAMWGAFPCFCRHICRTHLFAVLAEASFSRAVFCSCSSCTSRGKGHSLQWDLQRAEAQTNSTTLGDLGGIFDRVGGLRRGSLLLDIPPSSFRCEIRAHTERTNKPGLIFVVPTFTRLRRLLRLSCPGNDTHSALSEPCLPCSPALRAACRASSRARRGDTRSSRS